MSNAIEQAARELVEARRERSNAKAALLKYRQENGECSRVDASRSRNDHGIPDPLPPPCFQSERYFNNGVTDQWCEVCAGSEPLYQARKRAAIRVGKALRKLTNACVKSPCEQPDGTIAEVCCE